METITFLCWVYGDDVESIFPVEIQKNEIIGALKGVIINLSPRSAMWLQKISGSIDPYPILMNTSKMSSRSRH